MSELFTTIMADPGWQYRDQLRQSKTKRSSKDQYKTTMTVDEICAIYTPSRLEYQQSLHGKQGHSYTVPGRLFTQFELADTGFLWLWCTAATLLDGSATRVCQAWGYEPKQIGVWVKGRIGRVATVGDMVDVNLILQIGMGWTLRNVVEFFIIGTRGKYTKLVKYKGAPNVILAPDRAMILAEKREHSKKPDEIYERIESVCPGPYLELFARSGRAGWTSYGDELATSEAVHAVDDVPARPPTQELDILLPFDDGKTPTTTKVQRALDLYRQNAWLTTEGRHQILGLLEGMTPAEQKRYYKGVQAIVHPPTAVHPDPGLDGQWP